MGFNFRAILLILICASTAHAWGFLQPFCLSLTQSWHMHCGPLRCVRSLCVSHSLADIWIRSATLVVSCIFSRHFDSTFVIGCGFAAMWYHAGSRDLSCGVSLIAARFASYFWAAVTILTMSLFRFSACLPLMGMFHVCRKGFPRAWSHMEVGAVVSIIRSVTIAHAGRVGEKSK